MLNYNKIGDKVSGMKKQIGITGNKTPKNRKNRSQPDAHRPNAGPDGNGRHTPTTRPHDRLPNAPTADSGYRETAG